MRSALRRIGNSTGLIVPKPLLAEAGVENGTMLDLVVENGRIIASPVACTPRAGWAAAAEVVAGEPANADEVAWRDFGLDADDALEW